MAEIKCSNAPKADEALFWKSAAFYFADVLTANAEQAFSRKRTSRGELNRQAAIMAAVRGFICDGCANSRSLRSEDAVRSRILEFHSRSTQPK